MIQEYFLPIKKNFHFTRMFKVLYHTLFFKVLYFLVKMLQQNKIRKKASFFKIQKKQTKLIVLNSKALNYTKKKIKKSLKLI